MTTLIDGEHFERLCCGECGIVFYAPHHWVTSRRDNGENGKAFKCPNGHARIWSESALDRVTRERDRAVQEKACLADELAAAERARLRAEKETKRVKKRAAAALCPCCNRHFANVEAHMKRQHPEVVKLPERKLP